MRIGNGVVHMLCNIFLLINTPKNINEWFRGKVVTYLCLNFMLSKTPDDFYAIVAIFFFSVEVYPG